MLPEGVDAAPVKLELEQEGFECFEVDIGGRGVCGHGGDVDVE